MQRRTFIKYGIGTAVGGIALAVAYDKRFTIIQNILTYVENKDFDPNAFVFMQTDGRVKLICHRSEMGQGIRTTMAMIMADELDVAWQQVDVVQGDANTKYGSQNTDGSKSVRDFYVPLRKAAATAREMILQAAANTWNLPATECSTSEGVVYHKMSGQSLKYEVLLGKASELKIPQNPKIKAASQFSIIGTPRASLDLNELVSGKTKYGIDPQIDGMLVAVLARAPVFGAKIKTIDSSGTKKIKGFKAIVEVPEGSTGLHSKAAVAVVATHTWAAIKGRDQLKLAWEDVPEKNETSNQNRAQLQKLLTSAMTSHRKEGEISVAPSKSATASATYYSPYLVHAPMEPMVCTAYAQADTCEIWAPCQDPIRALKAVSSAIGVKEENIRFHLTFIGGGFGRKSQPDFVVEAAIVSKAMGAPVKVQWTREDEIQHGYYHAEALQKLEAQLDSNGFPLSWHHKSVFPSIMSLFLPGTKTPADWETGMGMTNMPYQIDNVLCEVAGPASSLRIGWLRSVCNLWHAFAVGSFVDELAAKINMDPILFQKKLIGSPRIIDPKADYPQDTQRLINVIDRTADKFAWSTPLPKGHGKGFAAHYSFLSYVSMAMEISNTDGKIKVERVVTTIDCGLAVNPDSVKAQMEGAIIFGLSAALFGKITLKDGVVEQSNYHDYPVLRMNESPPIIDVHIINGHKDKPTGVGEPGVPPVAPALANAIFNLTGKRHRDLPLA